MVLLYLPFCYSHFYFIKKFTQFQVLLLKFEQKKGKDTKITGIEGEGCLKRQLICIDVWHTRVSFEGGTPSDF
jgi:hypothetical protein